MNRRNKKRPGLQKEKVCMIAASVFVLSALTLTGVYMAAQNDSKNEENLIDFAKLEQQGNTTDTNENQLADERFTQDTTDLSQNNDMDVDPEYTEVNSGVVANSQEQADALREAGRNKMKDARFGEDIAGEKTLAKDDKVTEETLTDKEASDETTITGEAVGKEKQLSVSPSFHEDDTLQWPIVGEVLLDYSMDKAVYFPTMQQYRYNPSIVIAAKEGETITAAADGVVKQVYYDAQTGNSILFDIGDGYELTYGQLTDITLAEGDRVKAGDIVGKVAKPTIYYSVEGNNVYFKLTKDGVPVDPLSKME